MLCDTSPIEPDPFYLCPGCLNALRDDPHTTCPRCSGTVGPHTDTSRGCPACASESYPFGGCFRLGEYQGLRREAVLKSKHLRGELLAETLGSLWAARDREKLLAVRPDVVVPVPLHRYRRWMRGYNQAAAIADGLARGLGIRCDTSVLQRVRWTPTQTSRSAATRRSNLQGAFEVTKSAVVRNLTILLVDDVLTTGTTAAEATRRLLAAGATQVWVAVVAHR